jgi:hypothetical protein
MGQVTENHLLLGGKDVVDFGVCSDGWRVAVLSGRNRTASAYAKQNEEGKYYFSGHGEVSVRLSALSESKAAVTFIILPQKGARTKKYIQELFPIQSSRGGDMSAADGPSVRENPENNSLIWTKPERVRAVGEPFRVQSLYLWSNPKAVAALLALLKETFLGPET